MVLFWFMGKSPKITGTLFTAVFITCLGSPLNFGYSMAVLNNLRDRIVLLIGTTKIENDTGKVVVTKHGTTMYASLTASYIVLGTFGAFGAGLFSDTFGRRTSLFINNFIGLIGGLITLGTYLYKHIALLFVGRLILGLNAGLTTGIAPTYIAEIAPTSIRGTLTACHQLFTTIGIALAYLMTMNEVFNTEKLWILAMGMPAIFCTISILVLPMLPESPRYIYVRQKNEPKAIKAFEKFNQIQNASEQMAEIQKEVDHEKSLPVFRIIDLFLSPLYRKAITITVLLNLMQQFSGINAVIGYSSAMFEAAGVDNKYLQLCVLLVGLLNTLCTVPAVLMMDVFGRRVTLIIPTVIAILSLCGCFIMVGVIPSISPDAVKWTSIISVVFICTYILGFAMGLGVIPGILTAEIFTQGPRAAAYSIGLGVNWTCSFVVLMLYPIVNDAIPNGYVFIFFIAICIPCLLYMMALMPETKGRTFADISSSLSKNKVQPGQTA